MEGRSYTAGDGPAQTRERRRPPSLTIPEPETPKDEDGWSREVVHAKKQPFAPEIGEEEDLEMIPPIEWYEIMRGKMPTVDEEDDNIRYSPPICENDSDCNKWNDELVCRKVHSYDYASSIEGGNGFRNECVRDVKYTEKKKAAAAEAAAEAAEREAAKKIASEERDNLPPGWIVGVWPKSGSTTFVILDDGGIVYLNRPSGTGWLFYYNKGTGDLTPQKPTVAASTGGVWERIGKCIGCKQGGGKRRKKKYHKKKSKRKISQKKKTKKKGKQTKRKKKYHFMNN